MGFSVGGGGKIDPPSVSWFSITPAGIGLKNYHKNYTDQNCKFSTKMKLRVIKDRELTYFFLYFQMSFIFN